MFFRQLQTYDKCRFFTGVGFLQHFLGSTEHEPVIDAMNGPNKRRKATSVLTFHFLPQYKHLMVLNSLIDFCFDGGESKYITVNNYGASWVKQYQR